MTRNKINWEQFGAIHDNPREAFENLCRMLFKRQFFNKETIFNSKANHPGIEIYPILEIKSGKFISFQSKYFESRVDYSQIEKSIQKTLKHCHKQLDVFYLYTNKDIDLDSQGFKKCKVLLDSADIEIYVIANNEILDRVLEENKIAEYFFEQHLLDGSWFKDKLYKSLGHMGERYNENFNVSTNAESSLKKFLANFETIEFIEQKKNETISILQETMRYFSGEKKNLIKEIISKIKTFNIENLEEFEESFDWANTLTKYFSDEFESLHGEIEVLRDKKSEDEQKNRENKKEIYYLQSIINSPETLEFSEIEKKLILSKILIVDGEVGMGKSQLLSETAKRIVEKNGHAILVPSQVFLTSESIDEQIIKYLGLNIDFYEFLNVLDMLGELGDEKVYIFIDAINESSNNEIWKKGLWSLFHEIEKLKFVKIVVSYRSGYEKSVLDENIKQKIMSRQIPKITHYGFQENSFKAIEEFLNYNNIPFSPTYFLQSEMTNPLFLKMFCKVYDGDEFNFLNLVEKFLEKSDEEAQKLTGVVISEPIIGELVKEIVEVQLENTTFAISQRSLLRLEFWELYGITNKFAYVSSLVKSGILLNFVQNNEKMYRFGYELIENFVVAKEIIERFDSSEECKKYLRNDFLRLNNEHVEWRSIQTFITITSLFPTKFGEECIDIFEATKESDKDYVISEYVSSYSWRPSKSIDSTFFNEFVNRNTGRINRDTIFKVLIENSTKLENPLNAEFLHKILWNKKLNERDQLWTTYINDLTYEDERIFQLIEFLEKGKKLNISSENVWLLLILFSWLLTSTNRKLRDRASKAMIELLKTNFSLCLPLLKKFEEVNDPYIIQRLFGIVFGACTKNLKLDEVEFKELAEYVYSAIFDKKVVYPDILLRDYAKLIVEYFSFKWPQSETYINYSKILPPYKSDPIPMVNPVTNKEYEGGMSIVAWSMAPEGIAEMMYGDFGRYTFDSNLKYFKEVDSQNIYYYSMEFIENTLGYSNKLFSEYDQFVGSYDRHDTKKIERIGKKYQWIAMYNILARVSDYHELSDRWNDGDEEEKFDGAWNPYVRDFDPTVNINFLDDPNIPELVKNQDEDTDFIDEDALKEEIVEWVSSDRSKFFEINTELLTLDESQNKWVALDYYLTSKRSDEKITFGQRSGRQEKWLMAHGYFAKKSDYEKLKSDLENRNFDGRWFPEGRQSIYWLFNREYGWSSGYKISMTDNEWLDYEVETGAFETVKYPSFDEKYLFMDFNEDETEAKDNEDSEVRYQTRDIPIRELLAKVLPTSVRYLWESEYDSSQDDITAFEVPCNLLIDNLRLEQREIDGSYYDQNGNLASFYDKESEKFDSPRRLMFRKDILDEFLTRNELVMFWICLGEKQFITQEARKQVWSTWSGFLTLGCDEIQGNMVLKEQK